MASGERVVGTRDPRARLLEHTRRLFKNGLSSGKHYPPLPPGPRATRLQRGLLAAELAQLELAELSGTELPARPDCGSLDLNFAVGP